jgi:hypothetical protein
MNMTVLCIDQTGTCSCLYTELIDLTSIGRLEVRRATNIDLNNTTQHWEVKDTREQILYFSRSRTDCLAWEQEHLT